MNILFLSLNKIESIKNQGIYTDLLREFIIRNNKIYILSPIETRAHNKVQIIHEKNSTIFKVPTGNIQKTNIIEKGLNTVLIEKRYKKVIKKYLSEITFDVILYSTPPITFAGAVKYVKERDNARTYLLLKDIFPQNAVDLGMFTKNSILYKYFRSKEKKLYAFSDYIGCMSQANVDYVLKHNTGINPKMVEICPNSIEIIDKSVDDEKKKMIRSKYGIPLDKKVFVYGGNLGKPQGIDFLIKCIHRQRKNKEIFFLIVGDGTEYKRLEHIFQSSPQNNFKLMRYLPKEDYDILVGACDIGLIFLDYRFTIPNFPSRLLSYMQAKIPVLACTDTNTDVGDVIVNGEFGWWCLSNNIEAFCEAIEKIGKYDMKELGKKGFQYLVNNYSSEMSYRIIMKHWMTNETDQALN